MASRKKKRLSPMQQRINVLTEECAHLRQEVVHLEQTQRTFHEHARTLTIERNQLRRSQLLAKLTVADYDAVRNSIVTIRAAQSEIHSRLAALAVLFEIETKPVDTKQQEAPIPS